MLDRRHVVESGGSRVMDADAEVLECISRERPGGGNPLDPVPGLGLQRSDARLPTGKLLRPRGLEGTRQHDDHTLRVGHRAVLVLASVTDADPEGAVAIRRG